MWFWEVSDAADPRSVRGRDSGATAPESRGVLPWRSRTGARPSGRSQELVVPASRWRGDDRVAGARRRVSELPLCLHGRRVRCRTSGQNPYWTRSDDPWPDRPRLDPGHVPLLRGPRGPRTGGVRALYLTGLSVVTPCESEAATPRLNG